MSVSHSATVRGVLAEAIKVAVDQGSAAGKLVILTAADAVLATITLQDPAFSRTGAVNTLLGVPLSTTATATGTAAKCNVTDSDDNIIYTGSCGVSASDFTIDNTSITSGQTVRVTAHAYNASV